MKAPIRKSFRKWAVGVGCTLSVALMLQEAKNSDAFQGAHSVATEDTPSVQQEDPSSQDPVIQEWQSQSGSDSPSDTFSDDSSSSSGDRFGRSESGPGFRSRSGHS